MEVLWMYKRNSFNPTFVQSRTVYTTPFQAVVSIIHIQHRKNWQFLGNELPIVSNKNYTVEVEV